MVSVEGKRLGKGEAVIGRLLNCLARRTQCSSVIFLLFLSFFLSVYISFLLFFCVFSLSRTMDGSGVWSISLIETTLSIGRTRATPGNRATVATILIPEGVGYEEEEEDYSVN